MITTIFNANELLSHLYPRNISIKPQLFTITISLNLYINPHKCELCEDKIKTTFLEKLDETIIKTKESEVSKIYYIYSDCQKEHKEKLIE